MGRIFSGPAHSYRVKRADIYPERKAEDHSMRHGKKEGKISQFSLKF